MNQEIRQHSTSSVSVTCQNCKKNFVIEQDDSVLCEMLVE